MTGAAYDAVVVGGGHTTHTRSGSPGATSSASRSRALAIESDGKLVEQGTPAELPSVARDARTRRFLEAVL